MNRTIYEQLHKICPRCGGDIGTKGKCLKCRKPLPGIVNDRRFLRPYTLLDEKYVLFNVVGTGGFGVTYSAYDVFTRQHLAIKEFFPESYTHRCEDGSIALDSPEFKMRLFNGNKKFASEARKMLSLKDIHYVSQVVNLFSANNTSYIVMEFAEGITLKQFVDRHRFFSRRKLIKLLSTVFLSIRSLHLKGIVHCDISPDNIVVGEGMAASLLDFGAAKDIHDSSVDVTITVKHGYTPPELYKINAKPSFESDIYSLGATLYYCFFRHPLPIATNESAMKKAMNDIDRKFARNPGIAAAMKKALAFDRGERYSSVIDFLTDVANQQQ